MIASIKRVFPRYYVPLFAAAILFTLAPFFWRQELPIAGDMGWAIALLLLGPLYYLHHLLQKERAEKQQKAALLATIKAADAEFENFVRDINHAQRGSLNVILNGTDISRKEMCGPLNIENYSHYLDVIYEAGKQLETHATHVINPAPVTVKNMLEKCMIIKRKSAAENHMSLQAIIDDNLPEITLDALRIRQVILSLLSHSIGYTQPSGTITLTAEKQQNNLTITIADNGLGLNEEERTSFWNMLDADTATHLKTPTIDKLSFDSIRQLIALHKGTFHINARRQEGTSFVVTLPYETKTTNKAPVPHLLHDNVVPFPECKA